MSDRTSPGYRRRRSARAAAVACACAATIVATGQASSAAAEPDGAAESNVVVNGTFESSTNGWFASSSATLDLAAGHSGSASGRVANDTSGPATVALNDKVNTVSDTVKEATYTASAWVRLTSPGSTVGIRLMEYAGSTLYGEQQSVLTLSDTAWHNVSVTYTAATDGATLDLNVLGWSLPAAVALDVDDVTLLPSTSTVAPPPAPPAPTGWRQVWSDEFSGSGVDGSKWRVLNNEHHPNETSCLTNRPQNVSQNGGVLHIRAQRENYSCGGYRASFTSGYLDTIGKMSQTYGRFEMRAKLPTQPNTSKGMWPAFWLRPNDGGAGEIDIMEAIGSGSGDNNYNRVSQTLWYDYSGTHPRQAFSAVLTGSNMSEDFHTYAVEWEPTAIRWYIDGRLTYTRDRDSIWWISSAPFSKPYNIRLNLQVGGSWPGSPNSSTASTQDYQVDYVRVYQR